MASQLLAPWPLLTYALASVGQLQPLHAGARDIEEVDSDEWEDDDPVPVGDCLFCPHHSSSLDKSLTHMTVEHSFFLPDPEFLTNVEGLIEYLGAKVRKLGNVWIQTSFRGGTE